MSGREDILPAPCLGGMGLFPSQRIREGRLSLPLSQVVLEQQGE
jgi:hypothetical protein